MWYPSFSLLELCTILRSILGSELVSIFIFEVGSIFRYLNSIMGGFQTHESGDHFIRCLDSLSFVKKLLPRWIFQVSHETGFANIFWSLAKKVRLKCLNQQATNRCFSKLSCSGRCQSSRC